MNQRSEDPAAAGRRNPDWAGPSGMAVHEPKRCYFSDCRADRDLVDVAFVERLTAPSWTVRACSGCVDRHGILPLEGHPPGSPGDRVLRRPIPKSV